MSTTTTSAPGQGTGPAPVTLVLMTTNQGDFLAEALAAALAQDYPNLTLLVSDNASSDATPDIVAAAFARYRGPHRLRSHRFAGHLGGPAAHMTAALALVEDAIVVFQHGDDASAPGRVSALVPLFDDPAVQLAHSAVTVIDAAGQVLRQQSFAAPPREQQRAWFGRVQGHVLGATLALRRELMARFPPLDDRAFEDTTLPFRAALAGRVAYHPAPLLRYRRHGRNVTHALHDLSSRQAAGEAAQRSLERLRIIAGLRHGDLAHWRAEHPEEATALAALGPLIDRSLAEAEATADLACGGLGRRLRAAARLTLERPSARGLLLAGFQALMPGAYVAWRRGRRRGT